jgi:hypothetical protein
MLPGNDERKISMTNRVKVILTLKDGENKMQKPINVFREHCCPLFYRTSVRRNKADFSITAGNINTLLIFTA